MSESSGKGRALEEQVAKLFRKKLGVQVARDKRSGAGSHQKMDISDWFREIPFAIEVKNHKTIKMGEWMRQAKAGASVGQVPTIVFSLDGDVAAALPFSYLVDVEAELRQLRARVAELEKPVNEITPGVLYLNGKPVGAPKVARASSTCRNGHLVAPGSNKCLAKGCPYSQGYKAKK